MIFHTSDMANRESRTKNIRNRTGQRASHWHRLQDSAVHGVSGKKSDSGSGSSAIRPSHVTALGRRKETKWGKISTASYNHHERQVMENTYRMGPDPGKAFDVGRSRTEMEDVLRQYLDPVDDYRRENAIQLSQTIAEEVKTRIKELGFARYKIVADVVIGEKGGQGLQIGSRCVWSLDTDRMVTVSYQNKNLFAVASVYGVYFE